MSATTVLDTHDEIDSANVYIAGIDHPILTKEQEVDLARRIEAGDDAARHILAEHNLRLVISIAKHYLGKGLPMADLVQQGNLGLLVAVDKFDWRRGCRFSTMATNWIRQAIQRGIYDTGRTIRIPVHLIEEASVIFKAEAQGRPVDVRRSEQVHAWLREPISLSAGTHADDSTGEETGTLGERIADDLDLAEVITERQFDRWRAAVVAAALDRLTPRQRQALELRFGIGDGTPRTLDEVGRVMGVTRERVRQIVNEALARLRVDDELVQERAA